MTTEAERGLPVRWIGPTLNAPVAMGYVPASLAKLDTQVFAEVRGQRLPLRIAATPFVPNTYKR